ncbi:VanZ family protein [Skermanella pratensis]|uniref:VanZ family protein n=1 Tax=Skermanella pratensis TaxID=2233999 RepID=UPI001301404B|nr:VanZ family protein [Skermanella pratensis]
MPLPLLIAAWCAFALAVTAGCLVPADRLPARLPNDKLLHLLSYAALGLPVAALASTSGQAAAGVAALLLAGLAIEVAQHFVPGRSFCVRDLAANAAGVLIGTLAGLPVTL